MGERTSAASFGCNLEAVDSTARKLSDVHDELERFARHTGDHATDLGSAVIQQALTDFYNESSDQREKIAGSVSALAAMMQAVADGVRQVDQALAGSLPDVPPASEPQVAVRGSAGPTA